MLSFLVRGFLMLAFTIAIVGCTGGDKKAIKPETFEEAPKSGPSGAGTGKDEGTEAPPPPAP